MNKRVVHNRRGGRLAAVLVAVLVAVVWALPGNAAASDMPAMKKFISHSKLYTLSYPKSWTVQSSKGKDVFSGPKVAGVLTQIAVLVVPQSTLVTKSFATDTEARLEIAGGKSLKKKTTKVAGLDAELITAKFHTAPPYDAEIAVFVGTGKVHWEILLEAAPSEFAREQTIYLTMLKSFKLL